MQKQMVTKKEKQTTGSRRSLSLSSRFHSLTILLFFLCLILAKMLLIGESADESTANASIRNDYGPPALTDLIDSDSLLPESLYPDDATMLTGALRNGDTLETALRRAEVPAEARQTIIVTLSQCLDFKKLRPKDSFTVWLDSEENRLLDCTYEISPLESYEIVPSGEAYAAQRVPVDLEKRVEYIEGTINQSLLASLTGNGEQPEVAHIFADIFASRIDFNTEVHSGDRYRIIVEKFYKTDTFVLYGKVLFAAYQSDVSGINAIAYRHVPEGGSPGFFNENGEEMLASFIRSPIPMGRVSSGFTMRRKHPILGIERPHLGIDLAAPSGTPIMASADGKVISAGYNGGFGKQIIIQHGNGYKTHYGHLSKIRPDLKKGSTVKQKDIIGNVGSTGLSTGPHLDYRMEHNGVFMNPFSVKVYPKSVLKGSERLAFLSRKQTVDGMLAEAANQTSPVLHASRLTIDSNGTRKAL